MVEEKKDKEPEEKKQVVDREEPPSKRVVEKRKREEEMTLEEKVDKLVNIEEKRQKTWHMADYNRQRKQERKRRIAEETEKEPRREVFYHRLKNVCQLLTPPDSQSLDDNSLFKDTV